MVGLQEVVVIDGYSTGIEVNMTGMALGGVMVHQRRKGRIEKGQGYTYQEKVKVELHQTVASASQTQTLLASTISYEKFYHSGPIFSAMKRSPALMFFHVGRRAFRCTPS